MPFNDWLRRVFATRPKSRARAHERNSFRPRLEGLEDRSTPAAVPLGVDLPSPLVPVTGSLAYFTATDQVHGRELWKTDGTAAGTALVADLSLGTADSSLGGLTAFGGSLFFWRYEGNASSGTPGYQAWRSDGTAAGTTRMTDASGNPVRLLNFGGFLQSSGGFTDLAGTLMFTGAGADGVGRLWQSDGTQLVPGPPVGSQTYGGPDGFGNGTVWTGGYYHWGSGGLYRYDGPGQSVLLYPRLSGSSGISPNLTLQEARTPPMLALNGKIIFSGGGLWQTDGTAQGTTQIASLGAGSGMFYSEVRAWPTSLRTGTEAAVAGDTLFFTAKESSSPQNGVELWATDGTPTGTRLVKDINPGVVINLYQGVGSGPLDLVAVGDTVYFTADDGTHGRELWKSDGTAAGTVMVADLDPGSGTSDPADLTNVRGRLYFTAVDPAHGRELWTTDGTEVGTVLVEDLNPGPVGSFRSGIFAYNGNLSDFGGRLVFAADDGEAGLSLWSVDTGLPEPTPLLNRVPVARAYVRSSTPTEGVVQFSGAAIDPDGDPLTYAWDFGGGTTSTARMPVHTFPDDGTYTVGLTVTDPDGLQNSTTISVTVANVAPTAAITAMMAGTGEDTLSLVVTAHDPSSADQAAGFTYRVDWGDGVIETVPATPGNGSGLSISHAYGAAGLFRVQVSAADKDGDFGPGFTSRDIVAGSPGKDKITLTGKSYGIDEYWIGAFFDVTNYGQFLGTVTARPVPDSLPPLVLGGAGDDEITVTNWEWTLDGFRPLEIDGGDGADTYKVDFAVDFNSSLQPNYPPQLGEGVLSIADSGLSGDADQLLVNGTTEKDVLRTDEDGVAMFAGGWTGRVYLSGVESLTINARGGDDEIAIDGGELSGAVTVDGGDGSDTYLVYAEGTVSVSDSGTTGTNTVTIYGTSGADAITQSGSTVTVNTSASITIGAGIDSLALDGGDGGDTYTVNLGGLPSPVAIADSGASGNDTLTVNGTPSNDYIGVKNGTLTWGSPVTETVTFTGMETTIVHAGEGNDTINDPDNGNLALFGDAGDDIIIIASTTGTVSADGGAGSDTYLVYGGTLQGAVSVSDSGSTGTNSVTVYGTSGADAITQSGSMVIVNTSAAITLGAGITALAVDGGGGTGDSYAATGTPALVPTVTGVAAAAVSGTSGDDKIHIKQSNSTGQLAVWVNGSVAGTFAPTGRLSVYGLAGDDDIQADGNVAAALFLYGGDGNDRLKGGSGSNVLVGGAGDDLLVGGSSRDILIGDTGADRIVGNAADDILIAGTSAFDGNEAALASILAEWSSARSDAERLANLQGTGSGARLNGDVFLKADETVFDDGAADTLTGSAGQDWFWANLDLGVKDKITDLSASEFALDLDFING